MRRQYQSITSSFLRFMGMVVLLMSGAFLIREAFFYTQVRDLLPQGMTIAGIDVSGLTLAEAGEKVQAHYTSPIQVNYRQEPVELDPADVGFQLNLEGMLQAAAEYHRSQTIWQGYIGFILDHPLNPADIPLAANHNEDALAQWLNIIAGYLDQPVQQPELMGTEGEITEGKAGYRMDQTASLPALTEALYQPTNRVADLTITDEDPLDAGMHLLQTALETRLSHFDGIGSIYILDLETGEEITINADKAMSGSSIMKIAIVLEAFRNTYEGTPPPWEYDLVYKTVALSGNWDANILLDRVAQQDNAYLGSDVLTESMHRLGLTNTFIVTPYDEPDRLALSTLITEANSRPDALPDLDKAMQTTAADQGLLLSMLYHCTQGQGALLIVYPDQLSAEECQEIVDVLALNYEGTLIRFGVPADIKVSHKHGWIGGMYGDAGIVFSPNKTYVMVEYVYQEGGWLAWDIAAPLLRDMSRMTYNYFNPDQPYTGNPLEEPERFPENEITTEEPSPQKIDTN